MSEEKRADPQLDASRFSIGGADSVRNVWAITVEGGDTRPTREQILKSGFLAHVASRLRPYDRIEVRCDDGSFFAELLVLKTEHACAVTRALTWVDLDEVDDAPDLSAEYRVVWKGPHLKHCVVRAVDGEIVRDGCATKTDAQLWLTEHLKVVRKAA